MFFGHIAVKKDKMGKQVLAVHLPVTRSFAPAIFLAATTSSILVRLRKVPS